MNTPTLNQDALAFVFVALTLAVAGLLFLQLVLYAGIVRQLKTADAPLVNRSSRWALLRSLWRGNTSQDNRELNFILRRYRVATAAYAVTVIAWLVVFVLVLIAPTTK